MGEPDVSRGTKATCSWTGCTAPLDTTGRYCRQHRAEYMRRWRVGQPASDMTLAVRQMQELAAKSSEVDRSGWTDEQWVADARTLMDDIDGSIMALLNGHVMAMLRVIDNPPEGHCCNPNEPCSNNREDGTECIVCGARPFVSVDGQWYCARHDGPPREKRAGL